MPRHVRRAHAQAAVLSLPIEMHRASEAKYPPYVGILIAVGGSALLWSGIAMVAAAIV